MNLTEPTRNRSILLVLVTVLILMSLTKGVGQAQTSQKNSEELLLEIMDLHSQLVTNETFLAQAKMLGAYLEAAHSLEEPKKIKIYTTVLNILNKIKESAVQISPRPSEKKDETEQKTFEGEEKGKSIFVPGSALLEIFKADSIETIPKLPVIRAYWERDLVYNGSFLLPDRASEVGKGSRYVARFSFYYAAKEPGDYGFTLLHNNEKNACKLTIGGVDIAKVAREPSGQGVCNLKKGFHRLEFWLVSDVYRQYQAEEDRPGGDYFRHHVATKWAYFEVRVLTPGALDALLLTKDMMLLKKE